MKTRNKKLNRILPIVIISILLISIATAFAQPKRPMAIYGDVYVDDVLAGADLNVYAKFGTTEIASTTTNEDGHYSLSIPESSGVADGESIDLYVGTTRAETVTLEYENDPLEANLYVTGDAPLVNVAPVLVPIGAKEVNEEATLTFTATATDSDVPANTLTYSLEGTVTANAAIDPVTGVFTWTPTETQGGADYTFTVRVTDDGTPPLFAEETITVTVTELPPLPVEALKLDREWYHTGDTVSVTLNFTYQNEDPTMIDSASVWASSESEHLGETIALIETGVNTSLFKGTFKLVGETSGTGELLVSDGDLFWVDYWYGPYEEWDYATVDNKAPTVTTIEPLKNAITTNNRTTISAAVADANLKSAYMTVDGEFRGTPITETGTLSYTPVLENPLFEGLHTVIVHAEDLAGNVNTTTWSFTVDVVKPTATISMNVTGDVKAGKVEFYAEFSEEMNGTVVPTIVRNATAYLDFGGPDGWTAVSNMTYGFNATISGSYNGTAQVNVTGATDLAGNEMVKASYTFYIDTVPPTAPGKLNATVLADSIFLEWIASADLGSGMKLYDIIRNGTKVGSVDHPTVTFTDTKSLESGIYFYTVKAYDIAGNFATSAEANATYTAGPITSFNISLAEGWNLFSLPLIPDNSSIEAVLADILVNVTIVWSYDEATEDFFVYSPGKPSDLTDMVDGDGYWIKMTSAATLTVHGDVMPKPPALPPTYYLYEGWNLIGFKGLEAMNATDYLGTTLSEDYIRMYGFDDGSYFSVALDELMEPGMGYWIAMAESGTIYP